jgi:hypothetical protein
MNIANERDLIITIKDDDTRQESRFSDHFDDDMIIPFRISRKTTFVSCHLLAVSSALAFVFAFSIIGSLLLAVWLTSIFHWYSPRFSTIVRRLDFIAVFAAIAYGSYFAIELDKQVYMLAWFIGIAVVACVFITNETLYYLQAMKAPSGGTFAVGDWGTEAGTSEREWVYWRTAVVHALCVHVFANVLCIVLLIAANRDDFDE